MSDHLKVIKTRNVEGKSKGTLKFKSDENLL